VTGVQTCALPILREPAGGGEEVGEANAKPKKPARARKAKAESKPAEETKPEVKTPEQQWAALAEQFPQMPPYATLNKDEKIRWDDVANRGVANLAAANTILSTVVKAAPTEKVETPAAAGTTEAVSQINGTAEQKKTAQALARLQGWFCCMAGRRPCPHPWILSANWSASLCWC